MSPHSLTGQSGIFQIARSGLRIACIFGTGKIAKLLMLDICNAIEDYVNAHFHEAAVGRGEKLLQRRVADFRYEQFSATSYVVDVPAEKGQTWTPVLVDAGEENLRAKCPNRECQASPSRCYHVFSALFFLEEELPLFEEDEFEDEYFEFDEIRKEPSSGPAPSTPASSPDTDGYASFIMMGAIIDTMRIFRLCGNSHEPASGTYFMKVQPVDTTTAHQRFQFMQRKNLVFFIDIIYDGKETFKTKCTCQQTQHLVCTHVAACFMYIAHTGGHHYFSQFKDYTEQKNNYLKRYGLTVADPESKEFEWEVNWNGSLVLKSAPSFIIPTGQDEFYKNMKASILGADHAKHAVIRSPLPDNVIVDYEIGFVLNFTSSRNFGFELEAAFVRTKNDRQNLKRLSLHQENNWPYLQSLPDEVYGTLLALNEKNILQWLTSNGGSYVASTSNPWQRLPHADISKLKRRYFELLQALWPFMEESPFVFALKEGTFTTKNLITVKLGSQGVHMQFTAEADSRFVTITSIAAMEVAFEQPPKVSVWNDLLFEINGVFYLPASADYLPLMERFRSGFIKFPIADIKNVIKNVIAPLQARYRVEMKGFPDVSFITSAPQPRIMLSEMNEQYLMIRPQFLYDDVLVNYDTDDDSISDAGEQLKVVHRNKSAETKLYQYLQTLHPKFVTQRNNLYYYLPFKEVMVNNWFLNTVQQLQDSGFPVYGLQELKKFKYNTSKAKFDIKAGSGIDWFDLRIVVSWGDQHVPLKDIRKAIINNQEAVLLGDGTLGVIPEEWLRQYRPLMKLSSLENGNLRISKLHYTLLDDINDHLDSDDVKAEIAEKKRKLIDYDAITTVAPSSGIKASLRPYQISGFNWLQALDSLGWGGCLADDMGLGKTLQAITFLQYLKEKHPGSTHLVICPTSLIFNWESELQKFCPTLQYHIYYGVQRTFDDEHFERFDVVLTTYGMIRNDFERFKHFKWHYVILDESQAIKNPEALTTRAVQNLKSRNRIILSGTPVQNNTHDLYAQFTFLNPGFLGNREFFKTEFANAIDRNNDKEKALQLRRMIYPFMLRRTKEQVAKDLPDKTETVLWCSMDREQRNVYEWYKEHYRELLREKIDEEGIAKAGIYILEGLLRLRQICDHPALLKDKKVKGNSVKTDELMREISENAGEHKLLVFSQFSEMLGIIRSALNNEGIACCYLDGSTPAAQRKEQVKEFQENESVKVFLVSLKAGGVGLNLTAADYVYLVDPWWNPAAEQQAIDRTHRIGQTKKVFAYKMICKDTVEEKILQLQEKKKLLASELVSEDAGFVKKLTREDVDFLFS